MHLATAGEYYTRLPPAAKEDVREIIWGLSTMPAGQFIQFTTDATCIFVNYTIGSEYTAMWHFPSTGVAGMDLYGWDETNSTWRWTGTAIPKYPVTTSKLASFSLPPPPVQAEGAGAGAAAPYRSYRLHLPTYMAVGDGIEIGTSPGSSVAADVTHLAARDPIIWYGSSILQGKGQRMFTRLLYHARVAVWIHVTVRVTVQVAVRVLVNEGFRSL